MHCRYCCILFQYIVIVLKKVRSSVCKGSLWSRFRQVISGLWVGDCFVPDLAERREVGEAECTCLQLPWLARFVFSYVPSIPSVCFLLLLTLLTPLTLPTQHKDFCAMLLRSTSPMPSA